MFFVLGILALYCRSLTFIIMSRGRHRFNVGALMKARKVTNEKIVAEDKIIAEKEKEIKAKRSKIRRLDNKVSSH